MKSILTGKIYRILITSEDTETDLHIMTKDIATRFAIWVAQFKVVYEQVYFYKKENRDISEMFDIFINLKQE